MEDLVRQWFLHGKNKKCFTSRKTEAQYDFFFSNWMRKDCAKVPLPICGSRGVKRRNICSLMFSDLAESSSG